MTSDFTFGDWDIRLSPKRGGAVLQCQYQGRDILRPVPDGDFDILNTGGFCLVPFSNRIEDGQFSYGGRDVTLPLTHAAINQPIHGFGWIGVWEITAQTDMSVTLTYRHKAGDWPWAFQARQTLSVSGAVLTHTLSVTNLSEHAMPAGLGFHPYFPDAAKARLTASAGGVWQARPDGIPTVHADVPKDWDFSAGRAVAETPVDHCFTGAGPSARIAWDDDRPSVLIARSDTLPDAVIYTAATDDSFCYEPVSHANNALGRGEAMADLSSGETLSAWMSLTVE